MTSSGQTGRATTFCPFARLDGGRDHVDGVATGADTVHLGAGREHGLGVLALGGVLGGEAGLLQLGDPVAPHRVVAIVARHQEEITGLGHLRGAALTPASQPSSVVGRLETVPLVGLHIAGRVPEGPGARGPPRAP